MALLAPSPDQVVRRVQALCRRLAEAQVDAYLVPSADSHLNEYVPAYQQRRAAITGFTGSAGDALICPEGSHLFVDARYHLQAEQQVDATLFRIHKVGLAGERTLSEWLAEMEKQKGKLRVGFDPFVVAMEAHAQYQRALRAPHSALVPIAGNLVDAVWENRPSAPARPIYALSDAVTGRAVAEKLVAVREQMEKVGAQVLILTKLDEIAWLTNLRGSDIDYNPVFEAYLVLDRLRAVCLTRVAPPPEVCHSLASLVSFAPYDTYAEVVRRFVPTTDVTVWLDPAGTTMGTRLLFPADQRVHAERNPVVLMKAVKNPVEIASSQKAHRQAGAAKIRSLARLERLLAAGEAVSEKAFAEMLYQEYAREEGFCDLSFTTISAVGANGAIVHYAGASGEVTLRNGELFLIDSGAQIYGATTDDTRTILVGTVADERQRRLYTAVLRCHIRLALQKFPEGTSGVALDAIARASMWNTGLDYGHGTGHGVGAFLNVHEGPQRVATRGSDEPLLPGMIISNEPGYYEAGWGGIRLENLYVVTVDDSMPPHPSGKRWLRLEPLTLIPFDKRLVEWSQLTEAERGWLAWYHQQVWDTIGPLLGEADRTWLREACAPFFQGT